MSAGSEPEAGIPLREIEIEIDGDRPEPTAELRELRRRAERLERAVRELAEAARALAGDEASPSEPIDPAPNPLEEVRASARARAAGREDEAVRHAVRAARSLEAAGCRREARETLEENTQGLQRLEAESVHLLADAFEELGDGRRAGELLARAAEILRASGRPDRAVPTCRRAAALGCGSVHLHRTWGLALLALGEPESAVGHLDRWLRESPGDADAALWATQAALDAGDERRARVALEHLAVCLGLGRIELPCPELGSEVRARLAAQGGDALPRPRTPFWERPDVVGEAGDEKEEPAGAKAASARTAGRAGDAPGTRLAQPRIFIAEDALFGRARLSRILDSEGFEVLRCSAMESVLERLSRERLPLDLLILPIRPGEASDLAFLRRIRELPAMGEVPILGITTLDRGGLDLDALRAVGVAGLMDKSAIPEEVVFRVNSLARGRTAYTRRYDRAPVFLAVDVEADGVVTSEYASTLSCGGMCLVSSRPLERNTEVHLRFRLSPDGPLVEADARVLWQARFERDGQTLYRLGLFFYPLRADHKELVAREVARILSATHF